MYVRKVSMTKGSAILEIPISKLKMLHISLDQREKGMEGKGEKDWNIARTMKPFKILSVLKWMITWTQKLYAKWLLSPYLITMDTSNEGTALYSSWWHFLFEMKCSRFKNTDLTGFIISGTALFAYCLTKKREERNLGGQSLIISLSFSFFL